MTDVAKYLLRKVVYAVGAGGMVAGGAYLWDKPDITSWTIHGLTGAAISGIVGALLSGPLGGALSKKP